jgi:hypothetical protein
MLGVDSRDVPRASYSGVILSSGVFSLIQFGPALYSVIAASVRPSTRKSIFIHKVFSIKLTASSSAGNPQRYDRKPDKKLVFVPQLTILENQHVTAFRIMKNSPGRMPTASAIFESLPYVADSAGDRISAKGQSYRSEQCLLLATLFPPANFIWPT